MMRNFIKKSALSDILLKNWIVPLALFILCVLSYGLLIPWLGYYWDDWFMLGIAHWLEPSGVIEAMSSDRPFFGWLQVLINPLFGEAPLPWHLLALLARWTSAVAVWWMLLGVWPRNKLQVTAVACLFAVYPGFTQQPIARNYGFTFIILSAFLFSLGSMVWSLRKPRWFWLFTGLGLLSCIISLFTIELFVGLELLRPIFIWLILDEKNIEARQRLRRTLVIWFPYLLVLVLFLFWRIILFDSTRSATD